jgi:CheY-like chemotaxis protein
VASFEPEAKRKSLRLFSEQEGDTPKALADPKRLRQILTNLVGNGLKFTTSGHVVVRLKQSTDGERIVIDVTDTGIGMTEAQRRLLFRPFVQADKTIARRFGGSGLGLALSKRFAEGMGGALDVLYSEPGVGTTFRLELPGARAAGEGKSDMARAPEPRRDALRGQRILLVEDNEDVRTMFVEFLRARGATVVEASDGEEAFDRAREMTFDTILMDVRMPHVDGLEATRRLRAQGLTTPIIALTADAVSAQRGECFNAGCDAYLAKPIDLPTLVKQLEEQQFHGKGRNRGGQAGAASRGNASQR